MEEPGWERTMPFIFIAICYVQQLGMRRGKKSLGYDQPPVQRPQFEILITNAGFVCKSNLSHLSQLKSEETSLPFTPGLLLSTVPDGWTEGTTFTFR